MPEEKYDETEDEEKETEQNMEDSDYGVTDLEDEDRPRSPLKKDRRRTNVGVASTFQSSQKK